MVAGSIPARLTKWINGLSIVRRERGRNVRLLALLACPTFALALAPAMRASEAIVVIDGDTVEQGGVRWRLVGLDAPEIHGAKCAEERRLGIITAARLITLIEERGGALEAVTGKRRDKFGRKLGRLLIGGEDWAAISTRERLAVPFAGLGRRHDWCS